MVEVQRRHHPFNKGSNFTHSLRLSTPTWLRALEQLHGNSATESWHRCHSTETRLAKEVQLGRHQWMAMYRTRTIHIPINTSKKKTCFWNGNARAIFWLQLRSTTLPGTGGIELWGFKIHHGLVATITPLSNDAFIGSARFKAQTNKPCSLYYLNIFIPSQAHFATYVCHMFSCFRYLWKRLKQLKHFALLVCCMSHCQPKTRSAISVHTLPAHSPNGNAGKQPSSQHQKRFVFLLSPGMWGNHKVAEPLKVKSSRVFQYT